MPQILFASFLCEGFPRIDLLCLLRLQVSLLSQLGRLSHPFQQYCLWLWPQSAAF